MSDKIFEVMEVARDILKYHQNALRKTGVHLSLDDAVKLDGKCYVYSDTYAAQNSWFRKFGINCQTVEWLKHLQDNPWTKRCTTFDVRMTSHDARAKNNKERIDIILSESNAELRHCLTVIHCLKNGLHIIDNDAMNIARHAVSINQNEGGTWFDFIYYKKDKERVRLFQSALAGNQEAIEQCKNNRTVLLKEVRGRGLLLDKGFA